MHFWTVTILRVVPIFLSHVLSLLFRSILEATCWMWGRWGMIKAIIISVNSGGIARSQEKAISFQPFSLIWVYSRSYSLVCRFFSPLDYSLIIALHIFVLLSAPY